MLRAGYVNMNIVGSFARLQLILYYVCRLSYRLVDFFANSITNLNKRAQHYSLFHDSAGNYDQYESHPGYYCFRLPSGKNMPIADSNSSLSK